MIKKRFAVAVLCFFIALLIVILKESEVATMVVGFAVICGAIVWAITILFFDQPPREMATPVPAKPEGEHQHFITEPGADGMEVLVNGLPGVRAVAGWYNPIPDEFHSREYALPEIYEGEMLLFQIGSPVPQIVTADKQIRVSP